MVVLTTAVIFAREATVEVGIKGGLNFTTYRYSGPNEWWTETLGNSRGAILGVFFSWDLGPLTIQPEVFYSRRGAKQEFDGGDNTVYKFDCLEVPVLIKFSFLSGPINPVVFAGPFGAYNLSHKRVDTIGGQTETTDIRPRHSKSDYGLVFGGGLELKLEAIKFILEGRYTLGMKNIESESETDSFTNRGISILVGVGF